MLTTKQVLGILPISKASLDREIADGSIRKPIKVGRSVYFPKSDIYKNYLSKKANRPIFVGDKLLSSKQLEVLFSRSSAWVWIHLQKNKKRKEKAIYIRSRPYWLESEIYADKELQKYLEVAKGAV